MNNQPPTLLIFTSSENKRHKIIPTVHLILKNEGKFLLLRRQNTGFEDGNYSMVAGHVEPNESAKVAMIREAKEEALIDLHSDHLEIVHVMHRKSETREAVDFFVQAHHWAGGPQIGEPDKCDDLSWHKLTDLPKNTIPYIKTALFHVDQNQFYSEFGWRLTS